MVRVCALLVLGVALFAAEACAEDPPDETPLPALDRIVVLQYRNRTHVDSLEVLEDRISLAVSSRLIATGKVLLVPRDEVAAALDTLVPGQGYITNERQAYRLGQSVGATRVIFGSFAPRGNVLIINTYIVDCIRLTVHTVEQPEPDLDLLSGQVAVETARVVQGHVVGQTPREDVTEHAPGRTPSKPSESPARHMAPWLSLGATVGLGMLTYHYDAQSSDTWDKYLHAVREHEITRLYNQAGDYVLARNALAVLTLGSAAASIYYWFASDYGVSEQWSTGTPSGERWTAQPWAGARGLGVVLTRRF